MEEEEVSTNITSESLNPEDNTPLTPEESPKESKEAEEEEQKDYSDILAKENLSDVTPDVDGETPVDPTKVLSIRTFNFAGRGWDRSSDWRRGKSYWALVLTGACSLSKGFGALW